MKANNMSCLATNEIENTKIKLVRVGGSGVEGQCSIMVLGDAGEEVLRLPVQLTSKDKVNLLVISKKVRKAIDSINYVIRGSYFYRTHNLELSDIVNAVKTCLEEGISELEVLKYYLSPGQILLARELRKEGLEFRQKVKISKYVVDFHILGKRDIFIYVVREAEKDQRRIDEIYERVRESLGYGINLYWVIEEELLNGASRIANFIKGVASGKRIYPNGLMTVKRLNLDYNFTQSLIEIRLRKMYTPSKRRTIVEIYEVCKNEVGGYMLKNIGSVKLPKKKGDNLRRLAQIICDKLGYSRFYSYDMKAYVEIYRRLKKFGRVRLKVKKIITEQAETSEDVGKDRERIEK